jgi:hypothetical protein
MSLKVYALKGGFSAETRTRMITEATAILGKYSKTDGGQAAFRTRASARAAAKWS